MPNYCQNVVHLAHGNPKMIERVINNKDDLCEHFIPTPPALATDDAHTFGGLNGEAQRRDAIRERNKEEYGYANSNEFHNAVWGSKWDVIECEIDVHDATNITLTFDTAWTPVVGLYDALTVLGFEVEAYYFEGGCAFYGKYTSDDGDDYYEDFDNIPEDIDEIFNISEWYNSAYDEEND